MCLVQLHGPTARQQGIKANPTRQDNPIRRRKAAQVAQNDKQRSSMIQGTGSTVAQEAGVGELKATELVGSFAA
jgi:hypothetical protein